MRKPCLLHPSAPQPAGPTPSDQARDVGQHRPKGSAAASAIEAGRILLARFRESAERRADFGFESTLSGRTLHAFLGRLTASGYRPAATAWRLYDGSVIGRQRLIAYGTRAQDPAVVDAELWALVRSQIEGQTP